MYKLKRSRPVKAACFLLSCIFLFLFTLNAIVFCFALITDRTDFFSETYFSEYCAKEIFGDLAESKSWQIRKAGLIRYAANGMNDAFFEEHPQFKKGQTNFAFTVQDANGKTLITNFTPEEALGSSTNTAQIAKYEENGKIYTVYDLDEEYMEVEQDATETTTAAEPTSAAAETTLPAEPTNAAPEETTAQKPAAPSEDESSQTLPTEPGTTQLPAAETTQENAGTGHVNTNPVIGGEEEVFIQDDTAQGLKSILMYIYPLEEGINQKILQHCLELYHKQFEPREAQYYLRGTYEIYHQTDFAVSSNGTAYFIGVEREESPANVPEERKPVEVRNFTVTVSVDSALPVKDLAYYASNGIRCVGGYLSHIVELTVFFGIAALFFTVFSFCLAGYVKNEDAPAARGIHKLPFDILLLLFIAGIIAAALLLDMAADNASAYYDAVSTHGFRAIPGFWAAVAVCLPLLVQVTYVTAYFFAVKIKTRTVISSMLLVRFMRWCVKIAKKASAAMNVLWKLGVVYIAGGILGLALFFAFNDNAEMLLICYIVFKLLELIAFVIIGINLFTLQKGAKDISEGKRITVDTRSLFGEFKKHAEHLNNIGNGINAAVEERLKSENTKTELITNVSHDLKTPLTSIVNYIDLLKKEPVNNPKAAEYIEVIDRQSQRLKKLTTDIVDASKAAAGSVNCNMEPTDLALLLGQVKGEYTEKLAEKALTLVDSIPQEKITVLADGRLLWRVFDNLLNNVCKYSHPDTRVYVTLSVKNGFAGVVFRNISAQPLNIDVEALTDRFVRGDASRNTEGSGLGLYIAKSLCETMGGKMQIEIDGDLFKVTVVFPCA